MKLVTAIIQPQMLAEVIDAVVASGARGLTSSDVHGFGQQYGQQSAYEQAHWGPGRQAALLPKVRVDIAVPDDRAEAVVDAIAKMRRYRDHRRRQDLGHHRGQRPAGAHRRA